MSVKIQQKVNKYDRCLSYTGVDFVFAVEVIIFPVLITLYMKCSACLSLLVIYLNYGDGGGGGSSSSSS